MPIRVHSCMSIACDVCGADLTDFDSGAVMHFDTEAEGHQAARRDFWPVASATALICPAEDSGHQAAMDALLPAEPASPNQLTIDGSPA